MVPCSKMNRLNFQMPYDTDISIARNLQTSSYSLIWMNLLCVLVRPDFTCRYWNWIHLQILFRVFLKTETHRRRNLKTAALWDYFNIFSSLEKWNKVGRFEGTEQYFWPCWYKQGHTLHCKCCSTYFHSLKKRTDAHRESQCYTTSSGGGEICLFLLFFLLWLY